eukprot:2835060-Prymnesium_polylepis.1
MAASEYSTVRTLPMTSQLAFGCAARHMRHVLQLWIFKSNTPEQVGAYVCVVHVCSACRSMNLIVTAKERPGWACADCVRTKIDERRGGEVVDGVKASRSSAGLT